MNHFQIVSIISKAINNNLLHIPLYCKVNIYVGYILRSNIRDKMHGHLWFWYVKLPSRKDMRILILSHPFHHWIFSNFFVFVNLVNEKWHLILISTSYESKYIFQMLIIFIFLWYICSHRLPIFTLGCSYFLGDLSVIPEY